MMTQNAVSASKYGIHEEVATVDPKTVMPPPSTGKRKPTSAPDGDVYIPQDARGQKPFESSEKGTPLIPRPVRQTSANSERFQCRPDNKAANRRAAKSYRTKKRNQKAVIEQRLSLVETTNTKLKVHIRLLREEKLRLIENCLDAGFDPRPGAYLQFSPRWGTYPAV